MDNGKLRKPKIETAMNLEKLILEIMEKENTDKVSVKLIEGFWEIEPIKREKQDLHVEYVYARNKNKKN